MKRFSLVATLAVLAAPVFADGHVATQGDAAAGEEQFNRQCVACHVVQNAAGETLAGRNGKTGPNLFGLAGRGVGSVTGFRYSDSLSEMNTLGANWTQDGFVGFVQDPTSWIRQELGDNGARSRMAYKVRQEAQAYDIYAFLASIGGQ